MKSLIGVAVLFVFYGAGALADDGGLGGAYRSAQELKSQAAQTAVPGIRTQEVKGDASKEQLALVFPDGFLQKENGREFIGNRQELGRLFGSFVKGNYRAPVAQKRQFLVDNGLDLRRRSSAEVDEGSPDTNPTGAVSFAAPYQAPDGSISSSKLSLMTNSQEYGPYGQWVNFSYGLNNMDNGGAFLELKDLQEAWKTGKWFDVPLGEGEAASKDSKKVIKYADMRLRRIGASKGVTIFFEVDMEAWWSSNSGMQSDMKERREAIVDEQEIVAHWKQVRERRNDKLPWGTFRVSQIYFNGK